MEQCVNKTIVLFRSKWSEKSLSRNNLGKHCSYCHTCELQVDDAFGGRESLEKNAEVNQTSVLVSRKCTRKNRIYSGCYEYYTVLSRTFHYYFDLRTGFRILFRNDSVTCLRSGSYTVSLLFTVVVAYCTAFSPIRSNQLSRFLQHSYEV